MGDKKKILVVEDEDDAMQYLTTLLTDNGYEVVTARSGRIGIDVARSEQPDLITLDVSMPDGSGAKMLKQVQEDESTKHIPVVIVSGVDPAYKDFLSKRRAVKPPAAYFEKPINRDDFLAELARLLS